MITVSARMGASASAAHAAQPDACTAPTSPEHESEPEQVIDLTDLALLALRLSARMRAAPQRMRPAGLAHTTTIDNTLPQAEGLLKCG